MAIHAATVPPERAWVSWIHVAAVAAVASPLTGWLRRRASWLLA